MKNGKKLKADSIKRAWYEIDASSGSLGRIASQIAVLLRGKHKRDFVPHADMGDYVVAVNADKLKFTGRKLLQKKYYRHSGYLGGLKSTTLKVELEKNSGNVLQRAVYNMLDDLKFRKKLMSRLKIVEGKSHDFKIDINLSSKKN